MSWSASLMVRRAFRRRLVRFVAVAAVVALAGGLLVAGAAAELSAGRHPAGAVGSRRVVLAPSMRNVAQGVQPSDVDRPR